MSQKYFKTKKGTEIPLQNIHGKQYMQVPWRLVWFREEHPDWEITTDLVSIKEHVAVFACVIKNEKGTKISTGHSLCHSKMFPRFLEKAETSAVGRALALAGYGTQFTGDELFETESEMTQYQISDSPISLNQQSTKEFF